MKWANTPLGAAIVGGLVVAAVVAFLSCWQREWVVRFFGGVTQADFSELRDRLDQWEQQPRILSTGDHGDTQLYSGHYHLVLRDNGDLELHDASCNSYWIIYARGNFTRMQYGNFTPSFPLISTNHMTQP